MKEYLKIANGNVVCLLCSIVVIFVLMQAVVFMKKAWKRGMELGMEKSGMKKVMLNSAIFSIIPSLPILIILLILMPVLGKYFPWLRLSVIGSGMYENMAADVTAKAFGLSGIVDAGFTTEIFVSTMWVMTIGIVWGPLYTALGSKYIQKGAGILKGKYEKSFTAIFSAMFISLICVFSGQYLSSPFKVGAQGITVIVPLLVMITAACFDRIIEATVKKTGLKILQEFSFSICLVIGRFLQ